MLLLLFFTLFFTADDPRCFPTVDRISLKEAAGHLLGNPALPGGLLGQYKDHQLFLIRTSSADKAGFLLLDYKKTLKDPKYLANMGGFYGEDRGHPAYVFAKGLFLAGVIGLEREKADPIARTFAGRIPLK